MALLSAVGARHASLSISRISLGKKCLVNARYQKKTDRKVSSIWKVSTCI